MRVVLVCSSFPASSRPAELPSYAAIAVELARRGEAVDVLCLRAGGDEDEALPRGLRVHRRLRCAGDDGTSIGDVGHDCRALRRLLRGPPGTSVVFADAGGLSPALLRVAEGAPTVLDLSFDWAVAAFGAGHPWWRRCRELGAVERTLARAVGAETVAPDFRSFGFFVWHDARWKELLVRGLPVQSAKVLVAGVDTHVLRPRPEPPRGAQTTIVFHGSLTREGGLNAVFLALQGLPRTFRLRILARSSEDSYLAELAELGRAAGVTDRIEVVPSPGPAARAEILAAADVFVFPDERRSSFPRAALEAFAAGVPVVAARCPRTGASLGGDAFEDGANSLLFPAGDPRSLAAAVTRLASDRALRDRLVERARHDAETRFGAPYSTDQLQSVLRS
mgnify:CR=1 FL=1